MIGTVAKIWMMMFKAISIHPKFNSPWEHFVNVTDRRKSNTCPHWWPAES